MAGHIMYKGARWNEAATIFVAMPSMEEREALVAAGILPRAAEHHIVPVRMVKKGEPKPKNALVIPFREWREEDGSKSPVYGVPMKVAGWSMTNMVYLANDRTLLAQNGRCYLKQV
jgi:hypothetical protein